MTKEIALHHLKHGLINEAYPLTKADKQEIFKVLEQETVSKEVYDHEYFLRKEFELKIDELQRQLEEQAMKAESILNKIRAEIDNVLSDGMIHKKTVLGIIDKYKADRSEEDE